MPIPDNATWLTVHALDPEAKPPMDWPASTARTWTTGLVFVRYYSPLEFDGEEFGGATLSGGRRSRVAFVQDLMGTPSMKRFTSICLGVLLTVTTATLHAGPTPASR